MVERGALVLLIGPACGVARIGALTLSWNALVGRFLPGAGTGVLIASGTRRPDFFDEPERRDRRGFLRRLDSAAKAGSDPGPSLTTRN